MYMKKANICLESTSQQEIQSRRKYHFKRMLYTFSNFFFAASLSAWPSSARTA